jgi:hypothetical protein
VTSTADQRCTQLVAQTIRSHLLSICCVAFSKYDDSESLCGPQIAFYNLRLWPRRDSLPRPSEETSMMGAQMHLKGRT